MSSRSSRPDELQPHVDTEAVSVLEDVGFIEIPGGVTADRCVDTAGALEAPGGGRAGTRNQLDHPWCPDLAATLKAHTDVSSVLPPGAVAVQCMLFDKSADRNWLVALHQDLSIPVQKRVPHPGCTGWSEKEGVVYVQPPIPVLESLLAVRVHLDHCGPDNGPLRVVPRSHRQGRLSMDARSALRQQYGEVECVAQRGDVLVMRPLLLHSSSKALAPGRRRVLHFLFGPPALPCGLRWHRAI